MKINQKLQKMEKEKRLKFLQLHSHYFAVSNLSNEDKKNKMNTKIQNHRKIIEENREINYVSLFELLEKTKEDKKYIKEMDTKIVPYEIPEVYSLKTDIENLSVMKKRMGILSENICKKDVDSIKSDWEKIGGDINAAIYKAGTINPKDSD